MPIYEYQCDNCGRQFEVMQRMTEPLLATCEQCGGHVRRLISHTSFVLKGSGWYVTDYPSESRKKAMGPFKPELWAISGEAKEALYQALEDQFTFFYKKLNVVDTRDLIDRLVTVVEYHQPKPASTRVAGDDLGLAD